MGAAILVDNILKDNYDARPRVMTVTEVDSGGSAVSSSNVQEGYGFANLFDNMGHTSFKIGAGGGQVIHQIDFGATVKANGFALYGHNFTSSKGLKIEVSTDNVTYSPFIADAPNVSDGIFTAPNGRGFAFGAKGSLDSFRYLRIHTVGFDGSEHLSVLRIGLWLDEGLDISAPFIPPYFTPHEFTTKRNNKGNLIGGQIRKMPTKLSIKINALSESDLESTTAEAVSNDAEGRNFIQYASDRMAREPFFLMWKQRDTSDTAAVQAADEGEMYYCTVDRSLKQPAFSSGTILNWSFRLIGYTE